MKKAKLRVYLRAFRRFGIGIYTRPLEICIFELTHHRSRSSKWEFKASKCERLFDYVFYLNLHKTEIVFYFFHLEDWFKKPHDYADQLER